MQIQPKLETRKRKLKTALMVATLTGLLSSSEARKTGNPDIILPEVVREAIYYSINPFTYKSELEVDVADKIKDYYNLVKNSFDLGEHGALKGRVGENRRLAMNRLDAWRLYLGLDQKYGTFTKSLYKPSVGKGHILECYKFNNFWENLIRVGIYLDDKYTAKWRQGKFKTSQKKEVVKYFYEKIMQLSPDKKFIIRLDWENGVMNDFKISIGKDEKGTYISYYDRWDLKGNWAEGKDGTIGKPFEIYDRQYFDPVNFDLID